MFTITLSDLSLLSILHAAVIHFQASLSIFISLSQSAHAHLCICAPPSPMPLPFSHDQFLFSLSVIGAATATSTTSHPWQIHFHLSSSSFHLPAHVLTQPATLLHIPDLYPGASLTHFIPLLPVLYCTRSLSLLFLSIGSSTFGSSALLWNFSLSSPSFSCVLSLAGRTSKGRREREERAEWARTGEERGEREIKVGGSWKSKKKREREMNIGIWKGREKE